MVEERCPTELQRSVLQQHWVASPNPGMEAVAHCTFVQPSAAAALRVTVFTPKTELFTFFEYRRKL